MAGMSSVFMGVSWGRKDCPGHGQDEQTGFIHIEKKSEGQGHRTYGNRKPKQTNKQTWKPKQQKRGMNKGVWCPDSLHIRLPSLPHIHFYKCETTQGFVHFLISVNLLRAPHQLKDSCVLIELSRYCSSSCGSGFSVPGLCCIICIVTAKVLGEVREGHFSKNHWGIWSRVCY